jgi:CSLREA domain-containing protein
MRRLLLMLLFGVGLAVLPQAVASAADFTVNSNGDQTDAAPGNGTCATAGGVCTLRAAVVEAEGLLGADTITVPAMTVSLGAQLSITKTVTIAGAGARSTIITGTPGHVLVGIAGGDVTLRDLALQDGSATGGGGLGVYQTGPAATQLVRVRVSGHSVNSPLGSVYAPVYVSAGDMSIVESTISGNTTKTADDVYGGALYASGASTKVSIVNSTISNNLSVSTGAPGSDAFGGGVMSTAGASVTVRGSTIANNRATNDGSIAAYGGNLFAFNGAPITVENSIVSGGVSDLPDDNNCFNAVSFSARNIVSDGTCGAAGPSITIADPLLAPLAANGGPTDSRRPAAGSPAVDAAAACVSAADQRGQARPVGPACDLGSVEVGADVQARQSVSNPSPAPGSDIVFTAALDNAGKDVAVGATLTIDVTGAAQIVSATPTSGSCSVVGTTVTCGVGEPVSGTSSQVLIVARAPASGAVTSTVSAVSQLPDPVPGNNSAATTATVPGSGPTVAKCSNVIKGNAKANRLKGSAGSDKISGKGGRDKLLGRGGDDCLIGGKGRDKHSGGAGADTIRAKDKTRDIIRCGAGRDVVFADKVDRVAKDCERVR